MTSVGVYELERNDIEGAVRAQRELVLGATTLRNVQDDVAILLQLQEDPTELERRLGANRT